MIFWTGFFENRNNIDMGKQENVLKLPARLIEELGGQGISLLFGSLEF